MPWCGGSVVGLRLLVNYAQHILYYVMLAILGNAIVVLLSVIYYAHIMLNGITLVF